MKHISGNKLKVALLLIVVVSSVDGITEDSQYRWENSRGEPVYSDRPPPEGVDYEVISTESTLKRVVSSEEGAVPLETKPTASNEFVPVDGAEDGHSKKNPALCERARMNLVALETDRPLNIRNDKGEVKELSPEGRGIRKQNAKKQIDLYCD